MIDFLKELIDKNSSKSSVRFSMLLIVVVVLGLLVYLTVSAGLGAAEYLIWALAIGVGGKALDAFSVRKGLLSQNETLLDKKDSILEQNEGSVSK